MCRDGLDQGEELIVEDVFRPAPMHILQAQYTVLNYKSVDAVILKEAARFFAENKLDFALVVDEGRLRRVLELGIQAFYAEEGEKNG